MVYFPSRRVALKRLLALAASAIASAAAAQVPVSAFRPIRPVRLISPLLPGGATDAIVRPIAARLAELWEQPVIVENKPGGGTIIGTQAVATAAPDGHTFGVVISSFTINPSLHSDLPYDPWGKQTPLPAV